jgi:hypothetical protein
MNEVSRIEGTGRGSTKKVGVKKQDGVDEMKNN